MPKTSGKAKSGGSVSGHSDSRRGQVRASSVHRALNVLGDYWSLLIVRDAFLGVRSFEDFQRRLGTPRQTLVKRLRELVEQDVLYRKPYQERPLRYEYRLTRKGLDLYPFVLMIWRWQKRWGVTSNPLPPALVHETCGKAMKPVLACRACRGEIALGAVEFRDGPGAGHDRRPPPRIKRWNLGLAPSTAEVATHSAYLMADRWTHLILASVFLGRASYDALSRDLHIASNILAHRLRLLVETALLEKSESESDARRFVYELTDKSRDIFPMTLSLAAWADKWLVTESGLPLLRMHLPCGKRLAPVALCSACGEELKPREVGFEGKARP